MKPSRLLDWKTWTFDFWISWFSFVILATLATLIQPQSDTWWLLRTGKFILERAFIPVTDFYSSTVAGQYWPNHEWLTEVGMYATYAVGGISALTSAFALIIICTWLGLYALCEGAPRLRNLVFLVGLVHASWGWTLRPQMISLALFVLALHLIFSRRWWVLPPLFLLWANLHAGFVAGLVILSCAAMAYGRSAPKDGKRLLLIGGVSGLLTLINPLGWRVWLYVFNTMTDPSRRFIDEWKPASFENSTAGLFIILLIATVWTAWQFRNSWKTPRDWTLLIGATIFGLLACKSLRHSFFFDLLALPILSRWFVGTRERLPDTAAHGRFHQLSAVCFTVGAVVFSAHTMRSWPPPISQPVIDAITTCQAPIFNTYATGGELIWFAPSQPVFIDNRQDPYPHDLFLQAIRAEKNGEYRELFSRYTIRCAVVSDGAPLGEVLKKDGWSVKAHDSGHEVLEARP